VTRRQHDDTTDVGGPRDPQTRHKKITDVYTEQSGSAGREDRLSPAVELTEVCGDPTATPELRSALGRQLVAQRIGLCSELVPHLGSDAHGLL
jgi:hypothetical protein